MPTCVCCDKPFECQENCPDDDGHCDVRENCVCDPCAEACPLDSCNMRKCPKRTKGA